VDEAAQDDIRDILECMAATDFRERSNGLETLRKLTIRQPVVVGLYITKVSIFPSCCAFEFGILLRTTLTHIQIQ